MTHSVPISENKVDSKKEIVAQVIPMTDQIRRLQTIISNGFQNRLIEYIYQISCAGFGLKYLILRTLLRKDYVENYNLTIFEIRNAEMLIVLDPISYFLPIV